MMDQERAVLELFGQFLIKHLRDRVLSFYDNLAHGKWKAPSLLPLQEELARWNPEQREVVKQVVVQAIDHALHDFLFQIEEAGLNGIDGTGEHDLQIIVDGIALAGLSDGLHGLLFGEDGWEAKYSTFPPDTLSQL